MTDRVLTLADVALTSGTKKVHYSHHGYIIDADANVHALTQRWVHGVIVALLYPEVAQAAGYEPPVAEDGDLELIDVFKYQRFEHECSRNLPILRIALSLATGVTLVSTGRKAPTDPQLVSLLAVFSALGLRGTDTLTGEEDDITVSQFIDELRQRRNQPVDNDLGDDAENNLEGN